MKRVRLLAGFRDAGVQHPPGTELVLDDDAIVLLGADVEVLGDADGDSSDQDEDALGPSLEDIVKGGFREIAGQLNGLRATLEGVSENALATRMTVSRIERAAPDRTSTEHLVPSMGQGPERRSGRDAPESSGDSGADAPTAGAGSDDPPSAPDAGGGEAGAGTEGEERIAAIVAAVPQVPAEDRTKAGVPKVDALERVLGFDISAAERDAAWAQVSASPEGAAGA